MDCFRNISINTLHKGDGGGGGGDDDDDDNDNDDDNNNNNNNNNNNKVSVKFALEQAMEAQRGSRGIAQLFL
jgi:hypothetical protein